MCFVALQITRWLEITTEGDTAHVWAEDEQYYDAGDHRDTETLVTWSPLYVSSPWCWFMLVSLWYQE